MAEVTKVVTMKKEDIKNAMNTVDNYGILMYGRLILCVVDKTIETDIDNEPLSVQYIAHIAHSHVDEDDEDGTEYIITLICERP